MIPHKRISKGKKFGSADQLAPQRSPPHRSTQRSKECVPRVENTRIDLWQGTQQASKSFLLPLSRSTPEVSHAVSEQASANGSTGFCSCLPLETLGMIWHTKQ